MSKSRTRRRKELAPSRAPQQYRGAPAGARSARTSKGAARVRPPVLAGVALLAVMAAMVLIAVGGGIPRPTPKPTGAGAAAVTTTVTTALTGTVGAAGDQSGTAVNPTLEAMRKLSTLVTCAGKPCPAEGVEGAPVTLIEVSDFTCTHCRDFNRESEPIIEAKYVATGKMRYVAHVFAFNDASRQIAAAALCANEQGKYFAFKREAFDAQSETAPGKADFLVWARTIGVDEASFGQCVDEQRYLKEVETSTQEALTAGVSATPSFILNGLLTEGNPPLAEYTTLIDAALTAAGGQP